MTRLVALQHAEPQALLRALDAVWEAGAAALPLAPDLPADGTADLVARLRPAEVRTDGGTHLTGLDVPVPAGTALVMTTSGSTGQPRGIVLSHAALAASTRLSRQRLGAADGVPWLGVLPLHHVAGISTVLRSRAAGREPLLHPRDTPEVIAAVEPAWISLVPTQLRRLLDARADLARHHGVLLGGGAVPERLLADAHERGVRVVTSYGATETCGGCVYDGMPLDGVEVRADATGRLQLRTPTMATGERRPDGSTTSLVDADGWWTTSDTGTVTDGVVAVHGRADDVVVSGGENVPLSPVRAALADLDVVASSTVVGLPDPRWGTAVTAVVVPAADPPTLQQVRDALADRLPRTHLPTALVVVDSLPRTGLGKVTPAAVQAAVEDGSAQLLR